MPHRKTLSRLTIASLAAAAVAAPTALAQPADMHASTVHKPASVNQDLRTEATRDVPAKPVYRDLRTEGSRHAPRVAVQQHQPVPGPPTWPAHPQPISSAQTPVASSDGDGGGIDVPASLLILAGTLALAGGTAAVAIRQRGRVAH